jgi:hypothetical protein
LAADGRLSRAGRALVLSLAKERKADENGENREKRKIKKGKEKDKDKE